MSTVLFCRAQSVKDSFPVLIYSETFEAPSRFWPVMMNADNLFVIQDGAFILNRKNSSSPYILFLDGVQEPVSYSVVMTVKFETGSGEEGTIGMVARAQMDGKGAFVVEINNKKQYRVKQLVETNYKLHSGEIKTEGWVKTDILKGDGESNILEIRTGLKNHDLYINNTFLATFGEISYSAGRIGVVVGPSTRARIEEYALYVRAEPEKKSTGSKDSAAAEPDSKIAELRMRINTLNTQNELLKKKNKQLSDSLSVLRKEMDKLKK